MQKIFSGLSYFIFYIVLISAAASKTFPVSDYFLMLLKKKLDDLMVSSKFRSILPEVFLGKGILKTCSKT